MSCKLALKCVVLHFSHKCDVSSRSPGLLFGLNATCHLFAGSFSGEKHRGRISPASVGAVNQVTLFLLHNINTNLKVLKALMTVLTILPAGTGLIEDKSTRGREGTAGRM